MTPLGLGVPEMRPRYDAVVIGSGYGGAVMALRLAEAGLSVAVLERGRELRPGDFPRDALSFARASQVQRRGRHVGDRSALFRFVVDDDCAAAMGCALGGTSLINAGVALRPDPTTWDDPLWPGALRADRDDLLREGFDRAEAMLRPTPYPEDAPRLPKLDALEAAARAMGQMGRFSRPPLTIAFEGRSPCSLCGDCLSGCNTGAKTTLLETYLPRARARGAELFTGVDVRFVERAGGAWLVHYDPVLLQRDRFDAPPMFVRAGLVALAAGSIGTTEILLRSRRSGLRLSPALGRRFSGNGTTLVFGYGQPRAVRAFRSGKGDVIGPAIAGMIDVRGDDPMVIQETAVPRPLARALAGVLRAHVGDLGLRSIERTQCYAVTARDDSGGRLELDGEGLRIRWPGAGLQPVVGAIHARLDEVTRRLGGRFVANPAWTMLPSRLPITTHPLGGCATAEDGARGVVDHEGRVFAGDGTTTYEGLYVTDGSMLPGALGYNPLLTITALAERTATLLVRRILARDRVVPDPSPEPAPARSPGARGDRGVRFTERMVGRVEANGRESDFSFVCTLFWDDVDALTADPGVLARSIGTVRAPALSDHALRIVDGRFRLLSREEGVLRMRHDMVMESREGRRWFAAGWKVLDPAQRRGIYSDTSTLLFTLHEGSDASAPAMGRGQVQTRLRDLARQVSTMRGRRAKFLGSFARRMQDVYGRFFGLGGA